MVLNPIKGPRTPGCCLRLARNTSPRAQSYTATLGKGFHDSNTSTKSRGLSALRLNFILKHNSTWTSDYSSAICKTTDHKTNVYISVFSRSKKHSMKILCGHFYSPFTTRPHFLHLKRQEQLLLRIWSIHPNHFGSAGGCFID